MAQWVTIWRAAHLLGVPRGVLQQQVRRGEIELSDGLVHTETLLRLYPQAQLEEGGLLERVAQIRDEAFGRRLRERVLPSQEVLAQRLFRQTQELADVQRHLQRYHALVIELRSTLAQQIEQAKDGDGRLLALHRQLNDGLARALAMESVDMLDVMDDMLKVMSAQVTLRPSGHQFAVEGHDTLLQAGMRAGLKLNYGCGNGSCGMCKVRVTAGQVTRTMHTDYALSEAEKAQGYVLACAHTAASAELTLETLEAAGPDDIPEQQIVASVRAVRELGKDTRLLHLQTPRSHRLRFLAGQSLTLGLAGRGGGDDAQALHPIASCPCDDRNLQFFIARNADDPVARQLFDGGLKVGDAVTLWGPVGQFVLNESTHPLVFAACDTGFAPIKSLIEHALSMDQAPSMSLFWLATRPDGHFMANQCRAWSQALDPFEYTLSSDDDAASGAHQMVAAMRADLFDIECDYYIAGPQPFVQALLRGLTAGGVPAAQLHSEFTP
ncbi:MAG: 2Fe-2S iron-sulfur cluster binding domain-containing protein [Rubrivivax sp.]|nr:2Fe-2S iron-sulfur cluster binding domain-containing protein [Rubrivivax sp.]MBK7264084.1 2Fe-2S iron-sulfur cluster binding domain-containing protein [Rubrivivax sp.]MBK8525717.1 2Fe-2S iron-sulfur cluster binding domain-containing protein [Rubrivivax sp.]